MKRTIFALLTMLVVFVAVFAVLVLRPVAKVNADHHGCSKATLNGNYGFVATGFNYISINLPLSFSMLVNFNGNGGFSGSSLNIVGNDQWNGGLNGTFTGGTYTVNSDCTCTLSFPSLPAFNGGSTITAWGIVVDTGGDEVVGNLVSSAPSEVGATFDAKRVAVGKWGFF